MGRVVLISWRLAAPHFLPARIPDNPDEKVLCHIKSNLGPKTPSLTYTINGKAFFFGEKKPR